jgi:hypothetical protein
LLGAKFLKHHHGYWNYVLVFFDTPAELSIEFKSGFCEGSGRKLMSQRKDSNFLVIQLFNFFLFILKKRSSVIAIPQ